MVSNHSIGFRVSVLAVIIATCVAAASLCRLKRFELAMPKPAHVKLASCSGKWGWIEVQKRLQTKCRSGQASIKSGHINSSYRVCLPNHRSMKHPISISIHIHDLKSWVLWSTAYYSISRYYLVGPALCIDVLLPDPSTKLFILRLGACIVRTQERGRSISHLSGRYHLMGKVSMVNTVRLGVRKGCWWGVIGSSNVFFFLSSTTFEPV